MRAASAGTAVWAAWVLLARPEWTAILLMLSPFVLVPLGLRLTARPEHGPEAPWLNVAPTLAVGVAAAAAISLVLDPGWAAALLSVPWLTFTLVAALCGVARVLSRSSVREPGVATDAALVMLAVGGAWLTISRAGLNPLGFSDAIVQLTAVHFHYAGFALPIVAGAAAVQVNPSSAIPMAAVAGVLLTAAGIALGGWLEWLAATAMALAGIATAVLLAQLAGPTVTATRALLAAAAGSLALGMVLALAWAWSVRFRWDLLSLDDMSRLHGSLNALGFGLLGLIGMNRLPARRCPGRQICIHARRPDSAQLRALAETATGLDTTSPARLLRRPAPPGFRQQTWDRVVDGGNFAASCDAIRRWAGHRSAGIRTWPPRPPIAEGQTVALAIPVGPMCVSATCRIVSAVDEPNCFGFTYATLPHHPVDGEESFIVRRLADGRVTVAVAAVWRASALAGRIAPPLTRFLQNRAIGRCVDAIADPPRRLPH